MSSNIQDIKILVVDDEKQLADIVAEYLSSKGYQVTAAYGGREALDLFMKDSFQLVITDLMMPEMDGMELMEAVKKLDSKAVVIVITGVGTIESAVDAMKKGAYDFISKPTKLGELEPVVRRALERHTLSRQLGLFRGLTLALIISVPFWLVLGIVLALVWK